MVLMEEHTPLPGASLQGVGRGIRQRVLYKYKKEKIIYFFSLCVNYNNRSPTVGNDGQNGCHWRATVIYELTKDMVTNYIVAQLYF
jgi:hypothetical protein